MESTDEWRFRKWRVEGVNLLYRRTATTIHNNETCWISEIRHTHSCFGRWRNINVLHNVTKFRPFFPFSPAAVQLARSIPISSCMCYFLWELSTGGGSRGHASCQKRLCQSQIVKASTADMLRRASVKRQPVSHWRMCLMAFPFVY